MINLCVCANISLEDQTGGVDRILNLVKNVSAEKVNVYVVSRSRRTSLFSVLVDNSRYCETKNKIAEEHSYPLSVRFFFPGLTKLFQELLGKIICLATFSFSSNVNLSYVMDPYLFLKLFFVCKKHRITLLQFEFPTPSLSSFLVKKLLNIPVLYDAHNIESERLKSGENASDVQATIMKLLEIVSCKISDLVFVVSEIDKEKLISWGIPKNKIAVIPNSIEISKFSVVSNKNKIRSKYRLEKKVVLIFHGPLDYPPNEEAATILVKTLMPRILEIHPDVHLLLVGRNPPKVSLSNVIMTGFVENLPDYIAAADIALVPLLKGGGTRIKILEYMAAGKAVVSTVKGAEGLDLQNGIDILVTNHPDSQFVDLVIKLIEDNKLREDMGANARRKVESFYNWEETAKKAVVYYGKIIRVNERNLKHI